MSGVRPPDSALLRYRRTAAAARRADHTVASWHAEQLALIARLTRGLERVCLVHRVAPADLDVLLTALRHWRNSQTAWAYALPSSAARWLQLTVLARAGDALAWGGLRLHTSRRLIAAFEALADEGSEADASAGRLALSFRRLRTRLAARAPLAAAATAHHRRAACARCVATWLQHAARHTQLRAAVARWRRVETKRGILAWRTRATRRRIVGFCDTWASPSNCAPPAAPPTRGVRRRPSDRRRSRSSAAASPRSSFARSGARSARGSSTRARTPSPPRGSRGRCTPRERRASCAGGRPGGGTRRWRVRTREAEAGGCLERRATGGSPA